MTRVMRGRRQIWSFAKPNVGQINKWQYARMRGWNFVKFFNKVCMHHTCMLENFGKEWQRLSLREDAFGMRYHGSVSHWSTFAMVICSFAVLPLNYFVHKIHLFLLSSSLSPNMEQALLTLLCMKCVVWCSISLPNFKVQLRCMFGWLFGLLQASLQHDGYMCRCNVISFLLRKTKHEKHITL